MGLVSPFDTLLTFFKQRLHSLNLLRHSQHVFWLVSWRHSGYCEDLAKLGKSLKESGGAATEYQEAVAFLSSVSRTLSGIQSLIQDNLNFRWQAALVEQGDLLKSAIEDFEQKIEKYDKSLGSNTQRQKVRRIPREVQFALFLSDQVKELRVALTQPQLILDVFINLQILTSVLDISRTSSLSVEKLESLAQIVSQMMPAITTRVDNLDDVIKSEIRGVKSLQASSETQIREDLVGLKMDLREVEILQRAIAERSQADSQALLRPQVELQHSVQALHDCLQTQLKLLLQKKTEEPSTQEPITTTNSSQILFGVLQVIGSGIASGIGAMAVLSSYMSTAKSNETWSREVPHQPAYSTVSLPYEEAWENAYRAAEDEYVKNDSNRSEAELHIEIPRISSLNTVSHNLPSLIDWRTCHHCEREINSTIHNENCPDCGHKKCDECPTLERTATSDPWYSGRTMSLPTKKSNEGPTNGKDSSSQLEVVPDHFPPDATSIERKEVKLSSVRVCDWVLVYCLHEKTLVTFLNEIFGPNHFSVTQIHDRYCFEIPRMLTVVSLCNTMESGGYP